MTADLVSFPSERRLGRKVRRIFLQCVRRCFDNPIEDSAGFALVFWDKSGNAYTAYYTDTGPIGQRLMPSYAASVLDQHVAATLAQDSVSRSVGPDGGA